MNKKYFLYFALFISACSTQQVQISEEPKAPESYLSCPSLTGYETAESRVPRLALKTQEGPEIFVCGNLDEKINDSKVRVSEFSIYYSVGPIEPIQVLVASPGERYYVASQKNNFLLEELIWLPFGKDDENIPVPLLKSKITCDSTRCIQSKKECAFSVAKNMHKGVAQIALKLAKTLDKKTPLNDEKLSGKLLVRALVGDRDAEKILKNLDTHFILDSAIAEEAHEHQKILVKAESYKCL